MDVQEEVDYSTMYSNNISKATDLSKNKSNFSKSTNYKNVQESFFGHSKKDFKIVNVQCMSNKEFNSENNNLITVKSHLGSNMRPGDIFYGKT